MTKNDILNIIPKNLGTDEQESNERYEYISMRIDNLPMNLFEILYNIIDSNDYKKYSTYFKNESISKLDSLYKDEPSIKNDFNYIVAIINGLEHNLY